MKCRSCGQNLVFDKKSGIARCPDCRRTYKVSVMGKPKACPRCSTTLIDKGAFWQCPNCSNKYVFAPKSEVNKPSNNTGINDQTTAKNKQNNANGLNAKSGKSQELDPRYMLVEENQEIDENASIEINVGGVDRVVEPKLYDYDGTEYVSDKPTKGENDKKQSNAVMLSEMEHRSEIKGGKKSKVGLIFAILLGILITIVGIACYVYGPKKVEWFSSSMSFYVVTAFYALFAIICIAVSFKPIGAKRIGILMAMLYGLCSMLGGNLTNDFRMPWMEYKKIVIFGLYGLLLVGAFLVMVINCRGDFHRRSTVAGVFFFIFSLLALLVVAIVLIPWEKYKLDVLLSVIPYFSGLEFVLVMFSSYPLLSILAKPKQ